MCANPSCAWIASLSWPTSYAKHKFQVSKRIISLSPRNFCGCRLLRTYSFSRSTYLNRLVMSKEDGMEASRRAPEDVIRTLPPRLPEPERRELWEQINLLRQEKDLAAKEYRFEEAAKLKERALELMLQDPYACLELELQKAIEEERYKDAAIFSDAMREIGEPPKSEKKDTKQKSAPKSRNVFGFVPKDWPTKSNTTGAPNLRRRGVRDMTDNRTYESGDKDSDSSEAENSKEETTSGELNQSEYLRLEGFDSSVWEEGHLRSTSNQPNADEKSDPKQKLFTYRELLQIQNKSEAVTMGIRVRVESSFSLADSVIEEGIYTFVYQVEITNLSEYTVQLISREWDIQEVTGVCKTVTGTGVVGQQPIMEPGETFRYASKCPVRVPSFFDPSKDKFVGSMQGKYIFIRGEVGEEAFEVKIARFGFYLNFS